MSQIEKSDEKVIEGKTKIIWGSKNQAHSVIVESKNDITKNDDPSQTEIMSSKAVFANNTTCSVFQLLKNAGIPVAFVKKLSSTQFLAQRCKMIMLEVVGRRYAVGSYLKRSPNLEMPKGQDPHRFHSWEFELFLKTTAGLVVDKDGQKLSDMPADVLDSKREKLVDDPFISDPYANTWNIVHPKLPAWDKRSYFFDLDPKFILPDGVTVSQIETILRQVVLVLESSFSQQGIRFIDVKIEFGVNHLGELLVADVIDNDSWRLRDSGWNELSKQLFRDNIDMQFIKEKYELVSKVVSTFKIPKQVIVLWRGSENDEQPVIPEIPGVDVHDVTISGHKSPNACMKVLENILSAYPGGGVIITTVGMSNGLAPTLAARTSWPVISIPATVKNQPHDVWSSLEMPSMVPLLTVLNPKNAVLAALNILAQKNPVAYMTRQIDIEDLDVN